MLGRVQTPANRPVATYRVHVFRLQDHLPEDAKVQLADLLELLRVSRVSSLAISR